MIITPIKTSKVTVRSGPLTQVLDASLPELHDGDIIAITSKIVSICEGSVVAMSDVEKDELILQEADYYLPATHSKYGHHFSITRNTLIASAGIDESNGEQQYILWPKDSQHTANEIRKYLSEKYGLTKLGIVITDSTCQPLRRGTMGISLAHSGFKGLNDYIGKPDLFGRPFGVTQAGIASGVAAAAVLAMGEGAEQTPVCLLQDVAAVTFTNADPTDEELATMRISLDEDLFAPFLTAVDWQPGKRQTEA